MYKFYNLQEGCHARGLGPKGQSPTHINDKAQHPYLKPKIEISHFFYKLLSSTKPEKLPLTIAFTQQRTYKKTEDVQTGYRKKNLCDEEGEDGEHEAFVVESS